MRNHRRIGFIRLNIQEETFGLPNEEFKSEKVWKYIRIISMSEDKT